MPQLIPTPEEIESLVNPLIQSNKELLHRVEILTAVALATKWISREEAELLLECSANTLKANSDKWNLRYKKGKRIIKFWLPSIIKRMEAKKMLSGAIEKKIQLVFERGELAEAV